MDADTLGHTSAAVSWHSQPSWENELAQTSGERRSHGIHSLVGLLRVGREAHVLLSPVSLSPVSGEPSAHERGSGGKRETANPGLSKS